MHTIKVVNSPCTKTAAWLKMVIGLLGMVISVTIHCTIISLWFNNAMNLRTERFPPPTISLFVSLGVGGTMTQAMPSPIFVVAQASTTVSPAVTFCDRGTSITEPLVIANSPTSTTTSEKFFERLN